MQTIARRIQDVPIPRLEDDTYRRRGILKLNQRFVERNVALLLEAFAALRVFPISTRHEFGFGEVEYLICGPSLPPTDDCGTFAEFEILVVGQGQFELKRTN